MPTGSKPWEEIALDFVWKWALYELFPTMDILLEHLEKAKVMYTASNSTSHFITSIGLAWEELDKYYSLTEVESSTQFFNLENTTNKLVLISPLGYQWALRDRL